MATGHELHLVPSRRRVTTVNGVPAKGASIDGPGPFVVPERNTTIAAATASSDVRDADANFTLVLNTIVDTVFPSLG